MTNKNIWVADSETDPFDGITIPKPFIWGLYNGCDYYEFNSTDDFMAFVLKLDNAIIYAHNGGKFDWHFILDYLESRSDLLIIAGRLSKFKIGNVEFRDSINILPFPLSAYFKDDFDYNLLTVENRSKPQNKIKISNYLKSDCVNLFSIIDQFIIRFGLNLTLAGTAMKVFSKLTKTKKPRTNKYFYDEIAPFYYGGRVQCFKSGLIDYPFKVIDINSAYPSVMMNRHPYGGARSVSDKLPKTRAFIERAFITLTCISSGALPFRDAKKKLQFPDDDINRQYFITGHEYLAAIDTDTIKDVKIIEVITFRETIEFSDYVNKFSADKIAAKKSGDKAGYLFSKILLNSLYGKYGSNPSEYDSYKVVDRKHIKALEDAEGYKYNAMLGTWALCDKPIDESKQWFYNVAVAASITGAVRAQMWRSINQCQGVMYCDTDSIACIDTGSLELDAEKLGAWDIESECVSGGIAGKKLYAFKMVDGKYKTASKGVRLEAPDILKIAAGEVITHNPQNPSFSVKRGVKFNSRTIRKTD
tara:strand:+ start:7352 stop:8941 length:1590 start_codon:yes stop_codon:yes gene_type:complete